MEGISGLRQKSDLDNLLRNFFEITYSMTLFGVLGVFLCCSRVSLVCRGMKKRLVLFYSLLLGWFMSVIFVCFDLLNVICEF